MLAPNLNKTPLLCSRIAVCADAFVKSPHTNQFLVNERSCTCMSAYLSLRNIVSLYFLMVMTSIYFHFLFTGTNCTQRTFRASYGTFHVQCFKKTRLRRRLSLVGTVYLTYSSPHHFNQPRIIALAWMY